MESWWAPIDIYCERTDPSFWAEPLNFYSNASFVFAGIMAWPRTQHPHKTCAKILCVMAIIIGLGSALFHSFANRATQLADVVPIGIFIASYLFLILRHGFHWKWTQVALGFVGFGLISAGLGASIPAEWVNGSQSYLGTFITLIVISYLGSKTPASTYFVFASACFVLSLVFRSVDLILCPRFAIGTHFLWHICNGLVIYLCIIAYRKTVEDAAYD